MKQISIKWTFFSLIVLTVGCLIAISVGCTQQTDIIKPSSLEDQAYTELIKSLEKKSNDFHATHIVNTNSSRSFFSFIGKVWNAVKADAKATLHITQQEAVSNPNLNNGLTTSSDAATASKKAYKKTSPKKISYVNGTARTRHVIDSLLDVYTVASANYNLAKAHNKTILEMYKSDFDDDGETINTIVKARSISIANGLPIPTCSAIESANRVDDFINNYYMEDYGGVKTSQKLFVTGPLPEPPLNVLDTYFRNVENYSTIADVAEYSALFKQEIMKSNLNYIAKLRLREIIDLAQASFDLWLNIAYLE